MTILGLELWIGNHEGEARLNGDDFLRMVTEYSRLGEMRFMDTKLQIATQFIRQHPGAYLRLSAQRFNNFWNAPDGSVRIWVSLLAWLGSFVAFGGKGRGRASRHRYGAFPFVYYIAHNDDMYRHPTEPMILLAALRSLPPSKRSPGRLRGPRTKAYARGYIIADDNSPPRPP